MVHQKESSTTVRIKDESCHRGKLTGPKARHTKDELHGASEVVQERSRNVNSAPIVDKGVCGNGRRRGGFHEGGGAATMGVLGSADSGGGLRQSIVVTDDNACEPHCLGGHTVERVPVDLEE